MLGSAIINTAIGLVLLFAVTALLCSGFTETVSNVMQLRARYLLTGLRSMLDQPESTSGEKNVGSDNKADKGDLHTDAMSPAATKLAAAVLAEYLAQARAAQAAAAVVEAQAEVKKTTDADAAAPTPDTAKAKADALRLEQEAEAARANADQAVTQAQADRVTAAQASKSAKQPPPIPDLTLALFDHPAIKSLQSRRVGALKIAGKIRNPQYVSGRVFSRAIVDTLFPQAVQAAGDAGSGSLIATLRAEINRLPSELSFKQTLVSLVNRAGDDLSAFEASLEKWYDDQMAMISGWYKRWARVVLGVFGLVVAILVNIDTLQVAHSLYIDGPTQQAVVASAEAGSLCQDKPAGQARSTCAKAAIGNLKAGGIPIGYTSACQPLKGKFAKCWAWSSRYPHHWYDPELKIIGWLITAFAVSFGAPFWFEALSKLGNLRNTGTKPAATV